MVVVLTSMPHGDRWAFRPFTVLTVTRGFLLFKSGSLQGHVFFPVGMFMIGYCILMWGFVLWTGCVAWIHCAENDFFILSFTFLMFTCG